jgi:hypothetical protein
MDGSFLVGFGMPQQTTSAPKKVTMPAQYSLENRKLYLKGWGISISTLRLGMISGK